MTNNNFPYKIFKNYPNYRKIPQLIKQKEMIKVKKETLNPQIQKSTLIFLKKVVNNNKTNQLQKRQSEEVKEAYNNLKNQAQQTIKTTNYGTD